MSTPIIKLVRKITTGGSLRPANWEYADSFTTTTANCAISPAGELSVNEGVSKVILRATFPKGTTGTAFLAVKDKEAASATKPTNTTGWTIIGNGVPIANESATFELSMSDANGLTTNVGICAYTVKNSSVVVSGTGHSQV